MKWRIVPIDYIKHLETRAADAESRAAGLLDRLLIQQGQLPIERETRDKVTAFQTDLESAFAQLGSDEVE